MSGDATTTEQAATPRSTSTGQEPVALPAAIGQSVARTWESIERMLSYLGDWLNPILVKETRQALKSLQFTMTFVLVLVACWVVTIAGVAVIGPGIYYAAAGAKLLLAYYLVLAFPLIVVVPYAAFRSLAAEREDNTYDLLSITTLKPRQIISGKLGSTIGQMAVYFSAITPCLAFTYLLRGVDLPTILVLLVYTFFISLGLSMIGLLLATLSRQRFGQVFLSVAFVAFLILVFFIAYVFAAQIILTGYAFPSGHEFWVVSAGLFTFYVTFFALAFFAAAGMITFSSENRSTPLRICMWVQQAAFVGWFGYGWIREDYELEPIAYMAAIAAVYWYVMGTMLTAERAEMSHRIRRRLPNSFLGRVFFTWFNPGPSTGYMFVIANATAIVIIAIFGMVISDTWGKSGVGWPGGMTMFYLLIIGWGYLVAYLGLGLLVVSALRRVTTVTMLAGVLIHFLLVLAGSGIPTLIQLMSLELRYAATYSFLQVSNPIWSLISVADGSNPADAEKLAAIVPTAAICILLLNLPSVIRELQKMRAAPPTRVIEDEAELHPAPAAGPKDPWDETS